MHFQKLSLDDSLLRAVAEEGYEKPTPIQEAAIPQALAGEDLLATAQTGTGKTYTMEGEINCEERSHTAGMVSQVPGTITRS